MLIAELELRDCVRYPTIAPYKVYPIALAYGDHFHFKPLISHIHVIVGTGHHRHIESPGFLLEPIAR